MGFDPGTIMLLSGLLSGGIGALTGKPGEHKSTFSKSQKQGLEGIMEDLRGMRGQQDITKNQSYGEGQDWLSSLFNDPDFFNSIEAPLQRDFSEKTVPELANRFASMGSGGSTGSTAFRNALGREGSNLHTNIGALRTGLQQQGVNQGLQYSQQPISNMQQLMQLVYGQGQNNQYQPPSAGGIGSLAAPLIGGAAQSFAGQYGQQRTPGQYPGTY